MSMYEPFSVTNFDLFLHLPRNKFDKLRESNYSTTVYYKKNGNLRRGSLGLTPSAYSLVVIR